MFITSTWISQHLNEIWSNWRKWTQTPQIWATKNTSIAKISTDIHTYNKNDDQIPGIITQNMQTYEEIETKTEKRENDWVNEPSKKAEDHGWRWMKRWKDLTEWESEEEEGDDAVCFFVFVIILLLYAVGFLTHPFFLLRHGHDNNPSLGPQRRRFRHYLLLLTQSLSNGWCVRLAMVAPREINLKRFLCTLW